MFVYVVKRPIPHRDFDWYIILEKARKYAEVTNLTAHHNFIDHVLINNIGRSIQLKSGHIQETV